MHARPEHSLVCEPSYCVHTSHPPGDTQILTQDEEEEILKEEVKQPKQGDALLPNMLTSLNDNIAHMAKFFSTLSQTLASFTAEKGQKRDSRHFPDPAAKRQMWAYGY